MPNDATGGMTLLKFDGPFLVQKEKGKNIEDDKCLRCRKWTNVSTLTWKPDPEAVALCRDSSLGEKTIEEVLNTILPPIIWEEDGKTWHQIVSSEPAMRADMIHLQRELNHQLSIRQARADGICPIRRELYSQAFDELIRQVTINSPERGLLLLRVRDEMRMTVSAYQALNDSSSFYGVRKRPEADQYRRLPKKFASLAKKRKSLQRELGILNEELALAHRYVAEQKLSDDKRHFEQVQFLKRASQLLHQKLENLTKAAENDDDD